MYILVSRERDGGTIWIGDDFWHVCTCSGWQL
jgi:hypothetical protein